MGKTQYYYRYYSSQLGGGVVKKVAKKTAKTKKVSKKKPKDFGDGKIKYMEKIKKIPKSVYIPKGLRLDNSKIKGAGLGVFTDRALPEGHDLGKYKGIRITPEEYAKINRDMLYVWEINDFYGNKERPAGQKFDPTKAIGYIDGEIKRHSNYLRYLNHPTKKSEENVRAKQFGKDVHYLTTRPVKAGEELMVNYGPSYSQLLVGKVV